MFGVLTIERLTKDDFLEVSGDISISGSPEFQLVSKLYKDALD